MHWPLNEKAGVSEERVTEEMPPLHKRNNTFGNLGL